MSNEENFYNEVLENDGQAIEAYLENVFSKSVPPPEPPSREDLSFWNIAGLESSLFTLSAIGAAILSAIRTGGLFYILEVLLIASFNIDNRIGSFFGWTSMITALLAFEGFLLAYGLTEGRKSGKQEVSKHGLWISMITVVAVGIFSSFSIVSVTSEVQTGMNIFLALITGGASAFVAFFSTKNLGYILNHVRAEKNRIEAEHRNAFIEWRQEGVDAYLSSKYNIRLKRSQKIYNEYREPQKEEQEEYNVVGKPSHWRTVSKGKSKEWYIEIANLNDKGKKEKRAREESVTPRTIDNWVGNAQRDLCWQYINKMKSFPTDDVFLAFGMGETDVAKFVSNNAKGLLDKKVVDAHMINRANELLKNG